MASFTHRLTSVAIAVALSGSPAVLLACMALCFGSPAAAHVADAASADHHGHGAMARPAAVSPHAHHDAPTSSQPTASVANASPQVPSDARLVRSCDNCCLGGPVALATGPGVERTDAKALGTAPATAVVPLHVSLASHASTPSSPPVPPPSPTRAPLALRI